MSTVAPVWVRLGLPPIRDPGLGQVWVIDPLVPLSTRTALHRLLHAIKAVSRSQVVKLQLRAPVPERYADAAVVVLPLASLADLLAVLDLWAAVSWRQSRLVPMCRVVREGRTYRGASREPLVGVNGNQLAEIVDGLVDKCREPATNIPPLLALVPDVTPILSVIRAVGDRIDGNGTKESGVDQVLSNGRVVVRGVGERCSTAEVESKGKYHEGQEGSEGMHLECCASFVLYSSVQMLVWSQLLS